MARQSRAEKAIDQRVQAAYSKHFDRVQVNMMDLSKVMNAGRDALKAGGDLDAAMIVAREQYRQN